MLPFPETPAQSAYRAEFSVRNIDASRYGALCETFGGRARLRMSARDLISQTRSFEIFIGGLLPLDELSWPLFLMGGSRLRSVGSHATADLPVGVRSIAYREIPASARLDPDRLASVKRALGKRPQGVFTLTHDGDPQTRDLGYALALRLARQQPTAIASTGSVHACDYLVQRIRRS